MSTYVYGIPMRFLALVHFGGILPNPEFCICRKISLILQDVAVLCRTFAQQHS